MTEMFCAGPQTALSQTNNYYFTNGVKQGGMLYQALFNVYMNNGSVSLNQYGVGGYLGHNFINNMLC